MKHYIVVYDGFCNLCSNLVQMLERLDGGRTFQYVPMQDEPTLANWEIKTDDCQAGMILIAPDGQQRWQGSEAAEEIARLLPGGELFMKAYRNLPGLKGVGDGCYLQIRDNRYDWFGKRELYRSALRPI
jgi:predicted DCC family thiol-disulfide oxidoreductase YuxK